MRTARKRADRGRSGPRVDGQALPPWRVATPYNRDPRLATVSAGVKRALAGDSPAGQAAALISARCRRYSKTAGRTEMTMMARMTRLKFFFTNGRLPKK